MKKILPVLCLITCFLLTVSIFRVLSGNSALSSQSFMHLLNEFNYDFEYTQNYINVFSNTFNSFTGSFTTPLPSDIILAFGELFNRIGLFFQIIVDSIMIIGGFFFDFIGVFVDLVKLIFAMLGLGVTG